MLRVGLPDRFVTHGKPALLREEVGLTPEAVADRVAQAVLEPTRASPRAPASVRARRPHPSQGRSRAHGGAQGAAG